MGILKGLYAVLVVLLITRGKEDGVGGEELLISTGLSLLLLLLRRRLASPAVLS